MVHIYTIYNEKIKYLYTRRLYNIFFSDGNYIVSITKNI